MLVHQRFLNDFDPIIQEQLAQFSKSVWESKVTTFIDPAMGNGQYLRAIDKMLASYGHSSENRRKRIFGYEANKYRINNAIRHSGNIATFKIMSYKKAIKHMNNFDVIVGNPPFQEQKEDGSRKDQASNLWSKFWKMAIESSNHYVAFISPTTWLSPSSDLRGEWKINGKYDRLWDYFNSVSAVANIKDVKKYFPGVGQNFGYVIVDKLGKKGLSFTDETDTSLGCVPLNPEYFNMMKKIISRKNNLGEKFKITQGQEDYPYKVIFPMTKKVRPDTIYVTKGNETRNKVELYIYTDTKKEAEKIRKFCLKNAEAINKTLAWSGFVNIQAVRLLKYS